jgi:hypothetical protein
LPGAGRTLLVRFISPIALILMTVQPKADQPSAETGADRLRHRTTENKGALIRDHESGELIKENKEILTGSSVPLDRLRMVDPLRAGPLTLSFGPTL